MPKYYRVRTQEQWDWLKNKLEIEDDLHVSDFPMTFLDGDVFCGIYKYHDDPEPLIEVSQMMEGEKMEDYVEIDGKELNDVEFIDSGCHLGGHNKINGIQKIWFPKNKLYPKVRMSVAEKEEFDWLKDYAETIYDALDYLDEERTDHGTVSNLFDAVYKNQTLKEIDFARAWADPSLIDVIPEKKYWVKCYPTDDCYFYKYDGKILAGVPRVHLERFHFTAKEITDYHLDGNTFEKVEVGDAKEN